MRIWRLLKLEINNAFRNMAIDEAILRARIEDVVPDTLRFYRWEPSAVSFGKFQSIGDEAHLENCKKYSVDVVRRITGGGTVYHDAEDEITYSVVASKEDLETKDITRVYARIYAGLAESMKILGLTTDFDAGGTKTCPNLTVNGKKISGSAQCHKGEVVLQHGTLLVGVNLEKMFTFLRVPRAKTCTEVINIARDKVSSIKRELGKDVSVMEVHQSLIEGFQKALNIRLVDGELTAHERELVERLYNGKYVTDDWNFYNRNIDVQWRK